MASKNTLSLHFFSDPGHGWLKVKLSWLEELGLIDEISSYSYLQGEHAYLEEDADTTIFLNKLRATRRPYAVIEHCTQGHHGSAIRHYPYYSRANIEAMRKVPQSGMVIAYGNQPYTLAQPLSGGAWQVRSPSGAVYRLSRPKLRAAKEVTPPPAEQPPADLPQPQPSPLPDQGHRVHPGPIQLALGSA